MPGLTSCRDSGESPREARPDAEVVRGKRKVKFQASVLGYIRIFLVTWLLMSSKADRSRNDGDLRR